MLPVVFFNLFLVNNDVFIFVYMEIQFFFEIFKVNFLTFFHMVANESILWLL